MKQRVVVTHISLFPYTTRCKRSEGSPPPSPVEKNIRVDQSPAVQVDPNPYPCRANQSQIDGNAHRILPDQVHHPPLTVSAGFIYPEVNRPDPCIHNPPTRLEGGWKRWQPIDRHKKGSDDRDKKCCSDTARVFRRLVSNENPRRNDRRRRGNSKNQ